MNETQWLPTRAGSYTAYEPEYEAADGKWERVPTVDLRAPYAALGVPPPCYCGGITRELDLFGRAQAWALAWQFAAQHEAETGKGVRIRVAQYEVRYDLKARRVDVALSSGE